MRGAGRVAVAVVLALAPVRPAAAIDITFDYSLDAGGLFSNPQAVAALDQAAAYFEAFLDDLDAITPGGGNSWTASFTNPGTGSAASVVDLGVLQDEVYIFAGSRSIPGSTLGIGGPGGFSFSSATLPFATAIQSRGEFAFGTPPASRTDFGMWGGSVAFDTGASWNFDIAGGPSLAQVDFLSVAIHELAHVFGFGTADSFDNLIDFGPDPAEFTGSASVLEWGGAVPLEADPDPGHWAEGTLSSYLGSPQEAAMDPSISGGMRKYLTDLDYAGLTDIGWQVVMLPEPERGLLVAAALMLLTGLASMPRSRRRPPVSGRPRPRPRSRARRRAPRRSRDFVRASG